MTAYRYRALNPDGKLVKGFIEGDSERQVRGQLRSQSLRPVEVAEANRSAANTASWRPAFLQPRIGPRGLEFARARVEMKAIETILHLRRAAPRRMRAMVPDHGRNKPS